MVNIDVEKVKEIFYDIQEEGYYTHGLESDKIPEKITIDQGSNALVYSELQPILARSVKKLKDMGLTVVTHMSIATPTYVGSKFLDNKKKLLYAEIPKDDELTKTLKKYGKASTTTYFNYTPPAKVYSIYSIDIFIDPPAKKAKTTGDKIKDFLNFNKEAEPIEIDVEKEEKPATKTTNHLIVEPETKKNPWTPNASKNEISVTPSLTVHSFTVHVSDPTKKHIFKLYNFPANVINRKVVRERELSMVNTLLNRVGLAEGSYYWEVWCGGIILKEGKIRFS